jgi:hypothetical protein
MSCGDAPSAWRMCLPIRKVTSWGFVVGRCSNLMEGMPADDGWGAARVFCGNKYGIFHSKLGLEDAQCPSIRGRQNLYCNPPNTVPSIPKPTGILHVLSCIESLDSGRHRNVWASRFQEYRGVAIRTVTLQLHRRFSWPRNCWRVFGVAEMAHSTIASRWDEMSERPHVFAVR